MIQDFPPMFLHEWFGNSADVSQNLKAGVLALDMDRARAHTCVHTFGDVVSLALDDTDVVFAGTQ